MGELKRSLEKTDRVNDKYPRLVWCYQKGCSFVFSSLTAVNMCLCLAREDFFHAAVIALLLLVRGDPLGKKLLRDAILGGKSKSSKEYFEDLVSHNLKHATIEGICTLVAHQASTAAPVLL